MMRELIRIDSPDDPRITGFSSIRERDLRGRQGQFIAEGTVVLRMLAAAHAAGRGVKAESILLLENRVEGLADVLAEFPRTVPVHVANAAVFDAIAGFHMHRGVVGLGSRRDAPDLNALIGQLPQSSLVLAAFGLSNHDNAGSIFRNAAAFGADAVILDETSCDPLYRKAIRVSVGSVLTLPFVRQGSADEVLGALAGAGFSIWGLSPRGEMDLDSMPPAARTALVLGTEGEGLPDGILRSIRTARIRQAPGLDSLNVATAAGIALHRIATINGRI